MESSDQGYDCCRPEFGNTENTQGELGEVNLDRPLSNVHGSVSQQFLTISKHFQPLLTITVFNSPTIVLSVVSENKFSGKGFWSQIHLVPFSLVTKINSLCFCFILAPGSGPRFSIARTCSNLTKLGLKPRYQDSKQVIST